MSWRHKLLHSLTTLNARVWKNKTKTSDYFQILTSTLAMLLPSPLSVSFSFYSSFSSPCPWSPFLTFQFPIHHFLLDLSLLSSTSFFSFSLFSAPFDSTSFPNSFFSRPFSLVSYLPPPPSYPCLHLSYLSYVPCFLLPLLLFVILFLLYLLFFFLVSTISFSP